MTLKNFGLVYDSVTSQSLVQVCKACTYFFYLGAIKSLEIGQNWTSEFFTNNHLKALLAWMKVHDVCFFKGTRNYANVSNMFHRHFCYAPHITQSQWLFLLVCKHLQRWEKKRAIWLSVTQLSVVLHFGALLYRRAVSEQKKRSNLAEEKTALPYKREPIFKITLQEGHFGSLFFLSEVKRISVARSWCDAALFKFVWILILVLQYHEIQPSKFSLWKVSICFIMTIEVVPCDSFYWHKGRGRPMKQKWRMPLAGLVYFVCTCMLHRVEKDTCIKMNFFQCATIEIWDDIHLYIL